MGLQFLAATHKILNYIITTKNAGLYKQIGQKQPSPPPLPPPLRDSPPTTTTSSRMQPHYSPASSPFSFSRVSLQQKPPPPPPFQILAPHTSISPPQLKLQSKRSGWMTARLIIANVAVSLLWRIADKNFMENNFAISLDNFKSGRFHTLITNAFSHMDIDHILTNMFGLFFFGPPIGRLFGPEYLLKLYLAGAVVGSIFYLLHQAYKSQTSKDLGSVNHSRNMALGASAAVNAIVLLYVFLFPHATIYKEFGFRFPAYVMGAIYIGNDMPNMLKEDSNISGSAHLGGAVVAAIAWARIRKRIF
ncbi:RHOMBOID-like protein 12, mitochondrial [Stylosanthes scabra]|uniref:RHOMBOID-like protein 12, mitochondrial n=1 Tax=Stylosanthes scabra TaxID=79078 RepID=A0ABU6ST47_9FABA|nr:RHOMBOID-like protein 12, mitochondrial [Stylosanthes scabra]